MARLLTGFCLLAFTGCCSPLSPMPSVDRESPGVLYRARGQLAMNQGHPDEAIDYFETSLAVDPLLTRNHLSLAAAHLEVQDDAGACTHLEKFLQTHPEERTTRAEFAELLWRLHRFPEARLQFETVEAGDHNDGWELSLHRHRRLMEIAEAEQDTYQEHLHRGIGLLLMACRRQDLPDPGGKLPVEGLFCQAAQELSQARSLRPEEARPSWYLYRVWSRLGNVQPAFRALQEADAAAALAFLTPAERRDLHLARECRQMDTSRK